MLGGLKDAYLNIPHSCPSTVSVDMHYDPVFQFEFFYLVFCLSHDGLHRDCHYRDGMVSMY